MRRWFASGTAILTYRMLLARQRSSAETLSYAVYLRRTLPISHRNEISSSVCISDGNNLTHTTLGALLRPHAHKFCYRKIHDVEAVWNREQERRQVVVDEGRWSIDRRRLVRLEIRRVEAGVAQRDDNRGHLECHSEVTVIIEAENGEGEREATSSYDWSRCSVSHAQSPVNRQATRLDVINPGGRSRNDGEERGGEPYSICLWRNTSDHSVEGTPESKWIYARIHQETHGARLHFCTYTVDTW